MTVTARRIADDWLAVNQFSVTEKGNHRGLPQHRRPDVVLFVNGLLLAFFGAEEYE